MDDRKIAAGFRRINGPVGTDTAVRPEAVLPIRVFGVSPGVGGVVDALARAYWYQATYVTAAACMLARWVVAHLTNNTELLSELDSKSDELILPMTLLDNVVPERRRKGL